MTVRVHLEDAAAAFPHLAGAATRGRGRGLMGTEAHGVSNAKAKREFGWTLGYPTWGQRFPATGSSVIIA